jgi:hypothetical protein
VPASRVESWATLSSAEPPTPAIQNRTAHKVLGDPCEVGSRGQGSIISDVEELAGLSTGKGVEIPETCSRHPYLFQDSNQHSSPLQSFQPIWIPNISVHEDKICFLSLVIVVEQGY